MNDRRRDSLIGFHRAIVKPGNNGEVQQNTIMSLGLRECAEQIHSGLVALFFSYTVPKDRFQRRIEKSNLL